VASDPVVVLLLSLRRLGWSAPTHTEFVTDLGVKLDLMYLAPGMVSQLAETAAGRATDRHALLRQNGNSPTKYIGPLFWDQMLPLLDGPKKPTWTKRSQAAYRALVSNTHWPQARQARHDSTRTNLCQLCQAEAGSLWHRRYGCDASSLKRLQCTSIHLRQAAARVRAVSEEAGELFARGVFPDLGPIAPKLLTSAEAEIQWWNKPATGLLTGTLFTDGSGRFPQWTFLRRAGWAVVQVDRFGEPVAAAYGAVPLDECPTQVARDGEDFAISMLSVVAMPPFRCYID